MSKVITFSRTFPAYHPKAGQPTYFVEKFWNSIYAESDREDALMTHELGGIWSAWCEMRDVAPKHHTIRAGSRWKVGDKFSPRVWSGKPYNSKQIVIAPDTEIKKVFTIEVRYHNIYINGKLYAADLVYTRSTFGWLAEKDGLTPIDLYHWLKIDKMPLHANTFTGQIICWNESINY